MEPLEEHRHPAMLKDSHNMRGFLCELQVSSLHFEYIDDYYIRMYVRTYFLGFQRLQRLRTVITN